MHKRIMIVINNLSSHYIHLNRIVQNNLISKYYNLQNKLHNEEWQLVWNVSVTSIITPQLYPNRKVNIIQLVKWSSLNIIGIIRNKNI
jgi:hypothetical protein